MPKKKPSRKRKQYPCLVPLVETLQIRWRCRKCEGFSNLEPLHHVDLRFDMDSGHLIVLVWCNDCGCTEEFAYESTERSLIPNPKETERPRPCLSRKITQDKKD